MGPLATVTQSNTLQRPYDAEIVWCLRVCLWSWLHKSLIEFNYLDIDIYDSQPFSKVGLILVANLNDCQYGPMGVPPLLSCPLQSTAYGYLKTISSPTVRAQYVSPGFSLVRALYSVLLFPDQGSLGHSIIQRPSLALQSRQSSNMPDIWSHQMEVRRRPLTNRLPGRSLPSMDRVSGLYLVSLTATLQIELKRYISM